jgi:hypothetical protein
MRELTIDMTTTIGHWLDNRAYPGTSGDTAPVTNPATGEVTGQVASAASKTPAWMEETTMPRRG